MHFVPDASRMSPDDRGEPPLDRSHAVPHEGPLEVPLDRWDAAALTAAYRRYQAPLVRYARRLTRDTEAAHDVVQDVFVKLWERRETLAVAVSLQALLYTMTRNCALNLNRRSARLDGHADVETARDGAGFSAAVAAPDADLQAAELGRHLRRWIDALPPRRSEAFALSRFDGLSHAEIAEVMGLSVRTVDTHIVHALRDLRLRLDAYLADPSHPQTREP